MKRTPGWYAEHTAKMERQKITRIGKSNAEIAREWNGNIEPVKLTRRVQKVAPPLYPLVGLCRGAKLPEPVPEYEFAKGIGRKWRADYCWPLERLILEVEGGLWTGGRHSSGTGAIADLEKYSEAAILGYRVIYATPDQVRDGTALDRVMRALQPTKSAA